MHFGAYALDLLGWVGTNYDGLIMGLNVDFFGLFDLQNLLPIGPGLVLDQRYGFKFHTRICIEERNVGYFRFSYKDDSDLRTAHEKEAAKVGYMVRKFLEDLEIGHRIYVFKQAPSLSLEQIMAIQAGLSRRRPQKLLSVSTDTPGLAIDEVRLVAPGVKIAAIGRFSPGSRADLADHDGWEVICRTAALGSWG